MTDFITYLYRRLRNPLPGFESQRKMMPKSDVFTNHSHKIPENAIPCSVLLILQNKNTIPHILLTLRSGNLRNHTNQISFPGGKLDQNETAEDGALRETEEEIGLKRDDLSIIGKLSPLYMTHTNMSISPYLASFPENLTADFVINFDEVDEAFWVSLNDLCKKDAVLFESRELRMGDFLVPYWDVHDHVPLWGATAMILSELIDLYTDFKENVNSFNHTQAKSS
jgi:8-oxo-dGTP pyrophosphatase MutT (NUDIX family)